MGKKYAGKPPPFYFIFVGPSSRLHQRFHLIFADVEKHAEQSDRSKWFRSAMLRKSLRYLILQFDSDCLMASLSPAIQGSDIHSKAQMLRRSSGGSGSKKVNLESGCCTRLARSACGAAQFYMLALKYA